MRNTSLLIFLFVVLCCSANAQVTIVRSFPTDTFLLDCAGCKTEVLAVALTKGQQSIPMNLDKPVKQNLLHWKYYDDISKEDVIMDERPVWVEGTQLVDLLNPEEIISYHINLLFTDSLNKPYQIFMVLSGINRQNLTTLPLETTFDADTYAIFRFSALAQSHNAETGQKETYDCIDGTCIFEKIDTKTGLLDGNFYFTGSRVGLEHKIVFMNGRVKK